ncbi:MAG: Ig-like domain repeat protein [Rudaea sp.]|uniref:NHL domain-containing protein n=1 Tax=Rudaea sp. TaxID=2136325 RepID=UPI0039E65A24
MQPRPAPGRLRPDIPGIRAAFAALSMLLAGIAPASAQTITTVAGGAVCDNASALAVSVAPGGAAVDAAGNLYVAALTSHAVCKIAPGGAISVVAGNGTAGFSGDGGAATSAQLNYPNHVALDGSGNLYIADSSNQRIRKVTPAGIISTIAGNGAPAFGGDGAAATAAQLNYPSGLAFDGSGNLYIADTVNHRIRRISAGVISTVAGTGTAGYSGDGGAATAAQLNSPYGIALDGVGNVYVADRYNHRIRKITVADGKIATIAGTGAQGFSGDGGQATAATFNLPHAVAVDAAGNNVYVADWQNHRIRKITTADGKIATIAGNGMPNFSGDDGPAASAQLNLPQSVALDGAGNLFVSDYNNFRVRKIAAADAAIATVMGNGSPGWSGDGGAATAAQLGSYLHVAADAAGNVYVSDNENHRVRKVATDGTISTFAGNGTQGFSGDGGAATSAQLNSPTGIAFDDSGNLYIAEQLGNRIRKVATDGTIDTFAGNGSFGFSGDGGAATAASLFLPTGVAADSAGNVYIVDSSNSRIRRVGSDGTIDTVAGNGTQGFAGDNGPAIDAQLNNPAAVTIDRAGNLYIADASNHRIRKVAADGNITTIAGTGALGYSGDGGAAASASLLLPSGLAFNPLGELNIADWYADSVRRISADGTISRVAGNAGGNGGFSGDGGNAIDALLSSPHDIAFDAAGNLYIADSANRRIRKIASPYTQSTTGLRIDTPASAVFGESLAITVTVGAAFAPTGTVAVCLDGDSDPDFFCWPQFVFPCTDLPLSPSATPGEYVATCTTSTLPVGDHSIAALFSGDALNSRSFNLSSTLTVAKAATSVGVTAIAPGSIVLGQSATVTVALSATAPGAGTPSGTITIGDGVVSCSFSTPANDNCSITPTAPGARPITATYSGDADFLASTASGAFLLVNEPTPTQTPTTTTLSLAPNPVATNQAVTATLAVSGGSAPTGANLRAPASALPAAVTGTVVVSGGGQQCTATLDGAGAGSCTLSYTTPGSYAVTASYSGDAQNAPSNASTNLVVNAAAQPAAAVAAPALSWWALLALIAAFALRARKTIAGR